MRGRRSTNQPVIGFTWPISVWVPLAFGNVCISRTRQLEYTGTYVGGKWDNFWGKGKEWYARKESVSQRREEKNFSKLMAISPDDRTGFLHSIPSCDNYGYNPYRIHKGCRNGVRW